MSKYECKECGLKIEGKTQEMVNPLVTQHINTMHGGRSMGSSTTSSTGTQY